MYCPDSDKIHFKIPNKTNTAHIIRIFQETTLTYSGTVVNVLLEIFIFAKDWFSDEMIILDTGDGNQWCCIYFCQPCDLLSFLIILQHKCKVIIFYATAAAKLTVSIICTQ